MKEVSYTHHTLDDLFLFHSQHSGITSRQMHFITFFSFLLTLAGLRCVRCLVYGEVDSSVFFFLLGFDPPINPKGQQNLEKDIGRPMLKVDRAKRRKMKRTEPNILQHDDTAPP